MDMNATDMKVKQACGYTIPTWSGKTTAVEISISSETAKKHGYVETPRLYRKTKDGVMLDGFYWINDHCPMAETEDEAFRLLKEYIGKDILNMVNLAARTRFSNESRALMNRVVESKKAIQHAANCETFQGLTAKLAAGEITQQEFNSQVYKLIG